MEEMEEMEETSLALEIIAVNNAILASTEIYSAQRNDLLGQVQTAYKKCQNNLITKERFVQFLQDFNV